jgi:hypothetical protein
VKRVLLFWIVFAAVQWLVATALGLALFRTLDWRFEPFCEALLLPALSSAVLCTVVPRRVTKSRARVLAALTERPEIWLFLAADAVVLTSAILAGRPSVFSIFRSSGVPISWISLKYCTAAILGAREAARRGKSAEERRWLFAGSACAVVAALQNLTGWPGALLARLLPRSTTIFPRLAVHGILFVGAMVVLLRVASVVGRRAEDSGEILEAAALFPVAAMTILALNFFLRPVVPPLWDAIAKTLFSLGASAVLIAAAGLSRRAGPAGGAP